MTSRLSKDEYYLQMLKLVSARSTCIRRSVGAIITDEDGKVLSTGYNGPPIGFPHCITSPCAGASDVSGDTSKCMAVHSEQNALLQCNDLRRAAIMYCSCTPCFVCAKLIANTKIKRVVCEEAYADTRGLDVLKQADISVEIIGA